MSGPAQAPAGSLGRFQAAGGVGCAHPALPQEPCWAEPLKRPATLVQQTSEVKGVPTAGLSHVPSHSSLCHDPVHTSGDTRLEPVSHLLCWRHSEDTGSVSVLCLLFISSFVFMLIKVRDIDFTNH